MISIDGNFPRLGNSLFQLAAAITLADENGDEVAFPEWKYAEYFQGDFTPKQAVVDSVYREPFFHYQKIPYKRNLAISGYFQSYKYWVSNRKRIQKLFSLRDEYKHTTIKPFIISNYGSYDSCSVHLRLQDYKNHPNHHPITPMSYYETAMELVQRRVGDVKFFIFSDDKGEAKFLFSGLQTKFITEVVEDRDIMAYSGLTQTKHSIIGNSTFSLFPALLKDDGIKIAPKSENWFGNELKMHNLKDLIPEDWIRI